MLPNIQMLTLSGSVVQSPPSTGTFSYRAVCRGAHKPTPAVGGYKLHKCVYRDFNTIPFHSSLHRKQNLLLSFALYKIAKVGV